MRGVLDAGITPNVGAIAVRILPSCILLRWPPLPFLKDEDQFVLRAVEGSLPIPPLSLTQTHMLITSRRSVCFRRSKLLSVPPIHANVVGRTPSDCVAPGGRGR